MPPDPKPPTVEELVSELNDAINWLHVCPDEDHTKARLRANHASDALAARVRELEQQRDDGDLAFNHANECIDKLEADLETMKRERDEARGERQRAVAEAIQVHSDGERARAESATRKRIIEQQNVERLAIVEEAQRNDLVMRERAERVEAENARLRTLILHHHEAGTAIAWGQECKVCAKDAALREGREGKGCPECGGKEYRLSIGIVPRMCTNAFHSR